MISTNRIDRPARNYDAGPFDSEGDLITRVCPRSIFDLLSRIDRHIFRGHRPVGLIERFVRFTVYLYHEDGIGIITGMTLGTITSFLEPPLTLRS